jgi:hypothetical protein
MASKADKWPNADAYTRKHLDAWLTANLHLSSVDRQGLKSEMLTVYEGDPEYYDRTGWTSCYKAAKSRLDDREMTRRLYG